MGFLKHPLELFCRDTTPGAGQGFEQRLLLCVQLIHIEHRQAAPVFRVRSAQRLKRSYLLNLRPPTPESRAACPGSPWLFDVFCSHLKHTKAKRIFYLFPEFYLKISRLLVSGRALTSLRRRPEWRRCWPGGLSGLPPRQSVPPDPDAGCGGHGHGWRGSAQTPRRRSRVQ